MSFRALSLLKVVSRRIFRVASWIRRIITIIVVLMSMLARGFVMCVSAAAYVFCLPVCFCLGHFQVGSYRYRSLIEGLYTV